MASSSKFKVGDQVKALVDCHPIIAGRTYTVKEDSQGKYIGETRDGSCYCTCYDNWQLISSSKGIPIKEVQKQFFIKMKCDESLVDRAFSTIEDVKNGCVGNDIVYEVKFVKRFKLVDESIKLVELK